MEAIRKEKGKPGRARKKNKNRGMNQHN